MVEVLKEIAGYDDIRPQKGKRNIGVWLCVGCVLIPMEAFDRIKGLESSIVIARLQNQYPIHDWKIEEAKRVYEFLKTHRRFSRVELKLWLYREYYLFSFRKRESSFVKKLLSLLLNELENEGYIKMENGFYEVTMKPSIEDILRILQMQIFDLWL